MGLFGLLHVLADYLLSWINMVEHREIGWKTVDRKTGRQMREQQTLWKKLKLFALFNPLTEWIDTTHMMRLHLHNQNNRSGRQQATAASKQRIKAFVDFFHVNMNDFEPSDIHAYQTFEDFFIRAHKPGTRPINTPHDASTAVIVADSRVVVYETITESKRIWIKGSDFSITQLTMDTQIGALFENGDGGGGTSGAAVASFRLSPQDYHRYHSPVSGRMKLFRSMPGDYYQVDPMALRSQVNILTRNARDYILIESEEFGDVLFVAIGATDVGTVKIHDKWQKPGTYIKKGDELGMFQFGGSSIIVAFQKGRIRFDQDLLDVSKQAIAMDVEVGMTLGRAEKK